MNIKQIDDDINSILLCYDGMTVDEISNPLCVSNLRSAMLDIHKREWLAGSHAGLDAVNNAFNKDTKNAHNQ